MPIQTQTLAQLRAEIKREARVDGSNNLDVFINELITDLLRSYIVTTHYSEMLVLNIPITAIAATGAYALPANFQSMRSVRYKIGSGRFHWLDRNPPFVREAQGKFPRYYDIAGSQVIIYPFEGVLTTDTIQLDYYKYPDDLADGNAFPIPKLLPPLKRQAIARTMLYNRDLQIAAAFKGESVEVEGRSRHNEAPERG